MELFIKDELLQENWNSDDDIEHLLAVEQPSDPLVDDQFDPYLNPVPSTSKGPSNLALKQMEIDVLDYEQGDDTDEDAPASPPICAYGQFECVEEDPRPVVPAPSPDGPSSPPPLVVIDNGMIVRTKQELEEQIGPARSQFPLLPVVGASDLGRIATPTGMPFTHFASGMPSHSQEIAAFALPAEANLLCVLCAKIFKPNDMGGHMENAHQVDITNLPTASCHICGCTLLMASLAAHCAYMHHERMVVSESCLPLAVATHSPTNQDAQPEVKMIRCKKCPALLPCKASFRAHMKTHLNKSPQMCSSCQATYNTKYFLLKHKKENNHHGFSCRGCGNNFASEVAYNVHREAKTTDRNLCYSKCNVCSGYFANVNTLAKHHKVKHPITHWCGSCGLGFIATRYLRAHVCPK